MTGSGLNFDPVGGWWGVLALAAALLPVLAIGPRRGRLTPRRRTVLVGLRLASLILLLLVAARPAWETIVRRTLPGTLLILVDSSRSMQVEDSLAGKSRWEAVRESLARAADVFQNLETVWQVKPYAFAEETAPLPIAAGKIEFPEEASGGQTALGAALDDALALEAQQRIVGVLVLSDGAQRAFAPRDIPPQAPAQRMGSDGIPLFTFTFGQPSLGEQADLRVSDLLVNDVVFADTPMTVEGQLTAAGYANQEVTVQLLWEQRDGAMESVDTRTLTIDSGRTRYPLKLEHTPREAGEYKLTLEARGPEGELIESNNRQSTFVTVRKGGVSILYLAGATRIGGGPSVEPRFVRQALAAHADLNVQYELINYRTVQLDYRSRLDEGPYDVLLLGDLDAAAFNARTWKAIADRVEEGTGLAMLGGLHSFGPGGFRDTPLEDVLPIMIGRAERQNFDDPVREDMHLIEPLRMVPDERDGQVHPIFRLGEEAGGIAAWRELSPLDGANRFDPLRIKPNALVVARADNPLRSPLLVLGAWGEGRTAALAIDSTWHWQLEGFGEVHRRFWRQFVLWLAKKDDEAGRQVRITLDQRRYQPASRVEFVVTATDEEGEPLADAQFDVRVELPDGSQQVLRTTLRGKQRVGMFDAATEPGDYRVAVTARAAGETVGDADARFLVTDQDLELDQPAAEPSLMAALADQTAEVGGGAYAPEELPQVLDELQEQSQEYEEELVAQITLWDRWPTLLTLAALLSTEWFCRKRWGLV